MRSSLFDSSILGTAQQAVEFVSNILESSTEYSVIGKDLDGKILLRNEGARRMYGYEAEEVLGRLTSEVLHTPEDVATGKAHRTLPDSILAKCSKLLTIRASSRHLPSIGIRPEDQSRLFQAFMQVDGSSTRAYGGTGLGLHVAQKLASMIGGRVSFKSDYGKGSRFTISVPALEEVPRLA